jgi:regulator of CtrA degradation
MDASLLQTSGPLSGGPLFCPKKRQEKCGIWALTLTKGKLPFFPAGVRLAPIPASHATVSFLHIPARKTARGKEFVMAGNVQSLYGGQMVAFADKMKASPAFKSLFSEGMKMVEEAAAYLDGPGRDEAKKLNRALSLAYATESMRLTTRLMQLASWLLLQRAVNEGEMTPAQAAADKHKVRVTRQDIATTPEMYALLPERLRELSERSLRLQTRIVHLDKMMYPAAAPAPSLPRAIEMQFDRLRSAFAPQREAV